MCIYNAAGMVVAGLMILPLGPVPMAHSVHTASHQQSTLAASEIVVADSAYQIGAWFFVAATATFSLVATRAIVNSCHNRTKYGSSAYRILGSAVEAVFAASMAMMLDLMT